MMLPLSAYHAAILQVLGTPQGALFAMATAYDDPHRPADLAEMAALLAWSATGFSDAGELPLTAVELSTSGGKPTLYRAADMAPINSDFGDTFGGYIFNALRLGAGEYDAPPRVENVSIATRGDLLAVSVVVSAGAQVIAAHFGRMVGEPDMIGSMPANAFRAVAVAAPACVSADYLPAPITARADETEVRRLLQ